MEQTNVETQEQTNKTVKDNTKGLEFSRLLTKPEIHPYNETEWETRTARITNDKGETVFELEGAEVPKSWSLLATNVVASKYFRRSSTIGERETSVRQIIDRVVGTITEWGREGGYFRSDCDALTFSDELTHILVNQMASFNSPAWFNVGIEETPMASACFINSVEDSMESIMELAAVEANLFKGGSGSGTNLSTLRSSREKLSSGGRPSGPVSFMRGYDAFAGVIKSGGKTRRAAVLRSLDVDHPDILEFVDCKVEEEKKARALIGAGYDGSINGEAYGSVAYQNANNSVRMTDEFMEAAVHNWDYQTKAVLDGESVETLKAREVLRRIAKATHECGDPGLQFGDTINRWHTCKESGEIRASNPCSEYMFLDDSACNLASLNLLAFLDDDRKIDVPLFRHVVDIIVTAQDILIDNARYPTDEIAKNSRDFRPLGLGFANLGALLMSKGLPYDSDKARALAAAITALMTGEAYAQSTRLAEALGTFAEYEKNADSMKSVLDSHVQAIYVLDHEFDLFPLVSYAKESWPSRRNTVGFRNAQVTALAPTGTIALMMDCDTTGIEPALALVSFKQLVGGGTIKMVNRSVEAGLHRLGYGDEEVAAIVEHVEEHGAIEGAPGLRPEHLAIFDCALAAEPGGRTIESMGHIKMMSAVQPFISGAISKTVNVPVETSVDEIYDIYLEAWRLGLKSISVYRDGSKRTQPLSTQRSTGPKNPETHCILRRRLPDERRSITHKFDVVGHEGYLTAGMYDDGALGEIFITMAKQGSTISGLMDSFATAISIALQYGVPLEVMVGKFSHMRFEPAGVTRNPEIPMAKSIMDYIFRWLELRFLDGCGVSSGNAEKAENIDFVDDADAPPCPSCGSIMVRAGSCHRCLNCGGTSGCG